MMMFSKRLRATCVLVAAIGMAAVSSALADGHEAGGKLGEAKGGAVVEVTVVKIFGSTSEYLSKVGAIIDVIKKHEPRAEVHIYQAAFAGTDYGQIHISTRYPSFAALAAANPKIIADPEHDAAVEALAEVDREIISHYMLRDKTPR